MVKFKRYFASVVIASIATFSPIHSEAFSLKSFLANPFRVSVNNFLNPWKPFYDFNRLTGSNPIRGIPSYSLVERDKTWIYSTNTKSWDRFSWDDSREILTPPPMVVVTPPCNRGGPGITPC